MGVCAVVSDAERVAPASLFNAYGQLTHEKQIEFINILASRSTVEDLVAFIDYLPSEEYEEFVFIIRLKILAHIDGYHIQNSDMKWLDRLVKDLHKRYAGEFEELSAKRMDEYKSKRNRKSSHKTIRRNVEICDLRKQNRRKWSLSQLAKHFKRSQRTITLVIREEAKWRNLLSELPGSD
jgi:hypothetical protein